METTFTNEQSIINTLLLNSSFIDHLGLMHGKMGISIFFFHLARKTKNQIYEDYAGELIDEIYEEITVNTPIDFENGLAGIGWGIEHLVQNGFIEADTDEVLTEFDNRIFKWLIYNTPHDIGLLNGLLGIGAYLLERIQNAQSNDEKISTLVNKQTLIHLIDELDRKTQRISEVIAEPRTAPNRIKQSQTISNVHSKETNGIQESTTPRFDLIWNYPVLLWFLTEVYVQNTFNFKVEKIINRLIAPLTNDNNLPKFHGNRLLLALALIKLHQTLETNLQSSSSHFKLPSNVQTKETIDPKGTIVINSNYLEQIQSLSKKLLAGICRETIIVEIPAHNTSIQYGSSGIAWIYWQLYEYTNQESFKHESLIWKEKIVDKMGLSNDQKDNMGKNGKNAFGLLEGIAGQTFISRISVF